MSEEIGPTVNETWGRAFHPGWQNFGTRAGVGVEPGTTARSAGSGTAVCRG